MDAYRAVGFADEWRLHHQGGSLGYRTRERIATPGDATPIVAGQSYGWNPSIAGAKAEDAILCGGEVLTRVPHWPSVLGRPDILRV
jgi:antitoxin VapB